MTDQIHPCPVCSTPCHIRGGEDEPGEGGTRHYEPVGDARLRKALEGFDSIAAAVADKARAYTPRRYTDLVEAGLRERRAREARQAGPVTPERIVAAAAETFGVTAADLTGKRRDKEYTWPRQLACYLMRELCPGVSLEAVGKALGGRDHSTALHGERKVARLVAAGDRETVRDLDLVKEALGAT